MLMFPIQHRPCSKLLMLRVSCHFSADPHYQQCRPDHHHQLNVGHGWVSSVPKHLSGHNQQQVWPAGMSWCSNCFEQLWIELLPHLERCCRHATGICMCRAAVCNVGPQTALQVFHTHWPTLGFSVSLLDLSYIHEGCRALVFPVPTWVFLDVTCSWVPSIPWSSQMCF